MSKRFNTEKAEYKQTISTEELPPIEFFEESGLNRRQKVFCWTAVNNPRMSLTEAARVAGYTDPRQASYQLMRNPKVKAEYNFLMSEVKKKYELNHERAVQDLYDIRDKALESGSFNAAISAQNALLKVGGLVVEKKEVRFGKIDQMSREEIENRLKQLMGQEIIEGEINSHVLGVGGVEEVHNPTQDKDADNEELHTNANPQNEDSD